MRFPSGFRVEHNNIIYTKRITITMDSHTTRAEFYFREGLKKMSISSQLKPCTVINSFYYNSHNFKSNVIFNYLSNDEYTLLHYSY